MKLQQALEQIRPLDKEAMRECSKKWDSIAKPLYAFGKFETESRRIAGMTGSSNVNIDRKALVIMCGDHGVLEEGVSQSNKEVTLAMVEGFPHMKCSASRMAAYAHVDLFTVDIGVASDITVDGVINRKIAYGTKNMAKGPAMTYEEAIRSIEVGIDMVKQLKEEGYQIICTGEMGVGNTTPCSAMASLLLDVPVRSVTGRGSGLTNEGLEKKTKILERILEFHKDDINLEDPIDILAKVGGFEIGGMAGLYIGGAAFGMPVVADGVISCVAALLATRIDKRVRDYIMPSHISEEPAAKLILDALDFKPFLTCGMHLGEGTGAVALMPLFDMALDVYHNMSTFNSMDIMVYEPYLDEEEK